MSISARIGLVSIVLWMVGIWLSTGNVVWGWYIMGAALVATLLAVLWPDLPNSKYNLKWEDIRRAVKEALKESFHDDDSSKKK